MTPSITEDRIAGLRVRIEGTNAAGDGDALLFVHGWPDSLTLWDDLVADLSAQHRCIRVTLPGFEEMPAEQSAQGMRLHTLEDVTQALLTVARTANQGRPVTLVLHDWGCLFGYHLANEHPDAVRRVVGLDIGDAGSRAHLQGLSWLGKLGMLVYQRRLAGAFRRAVKGQGAAADEAARKVAQWIKVRGDLQRVRASMGWPYEQARLGAFKAARAFQCSTQRPMLFLYGTRKPFMFHSAAWVAKVNATPGCQAHGLDGGHWFMWGATQQRCHALVREWLAASRSVADTAKA